MESIFNAAKGNIMYIILIVKQFGTAMTNTEISINILDFLMAIIILRAFDINSLYNHLALD